MSKRRTTLPTLARRLALVRLSSFPSRRAAELARDLTMLARELVRELKSPTLDTPLPPVPVATRSGKPGRKSGRGKG